VIDEIAELPFLPVFPRAPVAIFEEVDRCDVADDSVGVGLDKGKGLIPVSIDVLIAIFEAELHADAVSLSIPYARNRKSPKIPPPKVRNDRFRPGCGEIAEVLAGG
jgi:hypothetical protein